MEASFPTGTTSKPRALTDNTNPRAPNKLGARFALETGQMIILRPYLTDKRGNVTRLGAMCTYDNWNDVRRALGSDEVTHIADTRDVMVRGWRLQCLNGLRSLHRP